MYRAATLIREKIGGTMRTDNGDGYAVSARSKLAFKKSKSGMVALKCENLQV